MKFLATKCLTLFVLFGSMGHSLALPKCEGSPTSSASTSIHWTDCFGIWISKSGKKYVGEWKDDKHHGQGTAT